MHKNILIPTDGSLYSERAAQRAVDIAAAGKARLMALYVIDPRKFNKMDLSHEEFLKRKQRLEFEGGKALKNVLEKAKMKRIDCDLLIDEGEPTKVISRVVKENNVDLIVLGPHPRKGVKRLFHKSVSKEAVREAACDVLLTA